MTDPQRPIRLALRQEGDWWVAYVALTDTMDEALEVGRIAMGAVMAGQHIKDAFQMLMTEVLRQMLADMGLNPVGWETSRAPESERGGQA